MTFFSNKSQASNSSIDILLANPNSKIEELREVLLEDYRRSLNSPNSQIVKEIKRRLNILFWEQT